MTDEIFKAKKMLDETEALWGLYLSAFYADEKAQAGNTYAEALGQASTRLIAALFEWRKRNDGLTTEHLS